VTGHNTQIDGTDAHTGLASIHMTYESTSPTQVVALAAASPVDLGAFNSVTFWAKASNSVSLDQAGFGYDGVFANSRCELHGLQLTTSWKQFTVPVPDQSKMSPINGLFYFQATLHNGSIWIDDVRFGVNDLTDGGSVVPAMTSETLNEIAGQGFSATGLSVNFPALDGQGETVFPAASYFMMNSSDPSVVLVTGDSYLYAAHQGDAVITGTVNGVAATGMKTVHVALSAVPLGSSGAINYGSSAIALLSGFYTSPAPVDTWAANRSNGGAGVNVTDIVINSNPTKKYTGVQDIGVDFYSGGPLDLSAVDYLNINVWTPDITALRVVLTDLGADLMPGGGDDHSTQVDFDMNSPFQLQLSLWSHLSIPLANLGTARHAVGQIELIDLSNTGGTLYLEEVVFAR
jgi:hypothetical protein